MTGIETALLLGGTALSATSAIKQGQAASAAADFQRQQVEEQKQLARLDTLDREVQRRRRLDLVLGQQRAQRAAFGLQADSPSFEAAQAREQEFFNEDLRSIRLQGAAQERTFGLQSDQLQLQSSTAMQSGLLSAGGSLFSGISSVDFSGGSSAAPLNMTRTPGRKPVR